MVLGVVNSAIKFATTFMMNVLNFDFEDKEKKINAAREEFDKQLEEASVGFSELRNVWNRDEDELNDLLAQLEKGDTVKEALDAITFDADQLDDSIDAIRPQNPIVGSQPSWRL